jgi:glucokinase
MKKILAGDVGGTKSVLALYALEDSGCIQELHKHVFASGCHDDFVELVAEFLQGEQNISAAVFGIAGPVKEQKCITTNLPWVIDAAILSESLQMPRVHLLNDLEAAAYGVLQLDEFIELNLNAVAQPGHVAVIAAGTGLGEAFLFFDGKAHHAMPSEGGHCEFGPQNELEDQLLVYLRERYQGHVSMERILCGDGFGVLYDFLKSIDYAPINSELEAKMQEGDRNAVISQAGLAGEDVLCQQALNMFVRIYGVEAGNLALQVLPKGGVYVAGGIAPKILPALQTGEFMQGFKYKGRLSHAIDHVPVRVVQDPEAPLLGAAYFAHQRLLDSE